MKFKPNELPLTERKVSGTACLVLCVTGRFFYIILLLLLLKGVDIKLLKSTLKRIASSCAGSQAFFWTSS